MPLSRRTRAQPVNIWPGFVDALTQLTMVIVFVLLVFTVGQFYLSSTVTNQDAQIQRLSQQINQLNDMLAVEHRGNDALKETVATLSATLDQTRAERDKLAQQIDDATVKATQSGSDLATAQQSLSAREVEVATLNQNIQSLQKQLQDLAAALDLAQSKDKQQEEQIADLGKKLDLALVNKVEELSRYRSEFFGKLREILGDRPDIRVVGDRFVFQSEVLFAPGAADLGDPAKAKLAPVVSALKVIMSQIPPTIDWILEVDGHTDRRPINTPDFHSNWELSTARAVSVVKFLIDQGIPAEHIAAAGFGEFQPLDKGDAEESLKHNRRIELKLTQR
jgi:chemotaxis protein MotB